MDKMIKYSTKAPEKKDDRVLRFIGSDESIDRDNERIMSSGWKLKDYKTNPVILLNHQHTGLPVAKAERVWVSKKNKALMFDVKFPEPEISSIGDTLYKLYSNGYMSATSVGFKPNPDKIEYGDGTKAPRATFNEQELLELSLVSVPANPRALLTHKGIKDALDAEVIDKLELNELEMLFDELFEPEVKADLVDEDIDEQIEEEMEELIDKVQTVLENETPVDELEIEQNDNEIVYCHECGKNINQDNSDSGYLDELFDDFCKPKEVNTENEETSLTDELLKEYFDKE